MLWTPEQITDRSGLPSDTSWGAPAACFVRGWAAMYTLMRDVHQQGDNIGHVLPAETMLLRMETTFGATMGIWQESD